MYELLTSGLKLTGPQFELDDLPVNCHAGAAQHFGRLAFVPTCFFECFTQLLYS
jgi:hypothetical protein